MDQLLFVTQVITGVDTPTLCSMLQKCTRLENYSSIITMSLWIINGLCLAGAVTDVYYKAESKPGSHSAIYPCLCGFMLYGVNCQVCYNLVYSQQAFSQPIVFFQLPDRPSQTEKNIHQSADVSEHMCSHRR